MRTDVSMASDMRYCHRCGGYTLHRGYRNGNIIAWFCQNQTHVKARCDYDDFACSPAGSISLHETSTRPATKSLYFSRPTANSGV